MAFTLTIAYILLTFVSVSDTFPDLAPYRIQLIVGILGIVTTLLGLLVRGERQFQTQVTLMTAFTAFVVLSWLPHGWLGGTIMALQQFVPVGLVFFLTAFNVRSVRDLKILRFCLLALTLYLVGRGAFDHVGNSENNPIVTSETEAVVTTSRLQAQGLLRDPNAFAQYLLSLLPLLLVGIKRRGWPSRFFVLPIAMLILVAIFFTHSRGALVGIVVLIGIIAVQRIRFAGGALVSAAAAAILIAAGFAGGRSISLGGGMDRLDIWSDGLGLFKSSPIWGIGYYGFGEKSVYTAHNSFLLCAVELGLIGFFLWMGLIIVSAWQLHRVAQSDLAESQDPELLDWANGVLLSLAAFLTPGFFLSETYAPMLYLLLGMSACITRLAMERTGQEILPEGNHWQLKTAIACVGSLVIIYIMVRLRSV